MCVYADGYRANSGIELALTSKNVSYIFFSEGDAPAGEGV